MTYDEFVNKYNGKKVEAGGSPSALYQCVDLANAYISEVLNQPIILGTNAQDFPSKAGSFYTWTPNSPTGVPEKGDIVIWRISTYGHIAISHGEGDAKSFRSFDQNWPVGTPAHLVWHDYNNVIGWLHPKGTIMITRGQYEGDMWEQLSPKDKHEHVIREQMIALSNGNLPKEVDVIAWSLKYPDTIQARKELTNKFLKESCPVCPPEKVCPPKDCIWEVKREQQRIFDNLIK